MGRGVGKSPMPRLKSRRVKTVPKGLQASTRANRRILVRFEFLGKSPLGLDRCTRPRPALLATDGTDFTDKKKFSSFLYIGAIRAIRKAPSEAWWF